MSADGRIYPTHREAWKAQAAAVAAYDVYLSVIRVPGGWLVGPYDPHAVSPLDAENAKADALDRFGFAPGDAE